jgi:hypothetical protein
VRCQPPLAAKGRWLRSGLQRKPHHQRAALVLAALLQATPPGATQPTGARPAGRWRTRRVRRQGLTWSSTHPRLGGTRILRFPPARMPTMPAVTARGRALGSPSLQHQPRDAV